MKKVTLITVALLASFGALAGNYTVRSEDGKTSARIVEPSVGHRTTKESGLLVQGNVYITIGTRTDGVTMIFTGCDSNRGGYMGIRTADGSIDDRQVKWIRGGKELVDKIAQRICEMNAAL